MKKNLKELENTDDQLNGLRERKAQLEEKMHVMQQTRRQLMQQLEALMSQLNVFTLKPISYKIRRLSNGPKTAA